MATVKYKSDSIKTEKNNTKRTNGRFNNII